MSLAGLFTHLVLVVKRLAGGWCCVCGSINSTLWRSVCRGNKIWQFDKNGKRRRRRVCIVYAIRLDVMLLSVPEVHTVQQWSNDNLLHSSSSSYSTYPIWALPAGMLMTGKFSISQNLLNV